MKVKTVAKKRKIENCQECGAETLMTCDHIVPLSILNLIDPIINKETYDRWKNSLNNISNTTLLCSKCNGRKGSKLNLKNPTTKKILKSLIKKLPI